ncbi:SCO family protein [Caulobacter sp. BK020]|uniref:SCO family protein n=1 Tax=Caulobacter sp. BK020 TaxID=2512117 RepID=UPI001051DCE5|nr:SCO family protein [Caulobacter sp. BK020]TCS17286.1 protein SCO1/2 [Caulobacter sp. BK020]
MTSWRIAAFALALAGLPLVACDKPADQASRQATIQIGGPFQLVDMNGRPVTEKTLLGKPTAIFFGFTYCPEVCPTTMAEMTAWLKALGPDADRLNVVFVSVDPERDTPEQLKLYLSNFDPRIQGFAGTPEAIAKTAKAYRVYYQKVATEGGGYTLDHSSAIYLFDAQGRFVEPIGYGGPPERGLAQLKALLKG